MARMRLSWPRVLNATRYDPNLGRQTSTFVPAEDIILPYGTTDMDSCYRLTHVMRKTANEIAACPPLTVQGAKEVLVYGRDHGIQAGLEYVAQKNAATLLSEDLMEAVKSFMEKRPPVYQGK